MHTDLDTLATALYVTIDDTLKTTPELRRWRPAMGVRLLRPAFANEPSRPGGRLLGTIRQLIESVNDTRKGQLDLERHGGRTIEGVMVRVLQRLLALTAAIWHNHSTGQPVMRSLIAYDHYC